MSSHQPYQSPIEYVKQEIQKRVVERIQGENPEEKMTLAEWYSQETRFTIDSAIEYFAEHLDEIHAKFEQQQSYNYQLEERIRLLESKS